MVSGKTQAVDSAFIKANASLDNLAETELERKSKKYFDEITENEEGEECKRNQKKSAKTKSGKKTCGRSKFHLFHILCLQNKEVTRKRETLSSAL